MHVFADHDNFILCHAQGTEKLFSAGSKPVFLCVGRAEVFACDALFHFCNYLFGIWLFRLGSRHVPSGMDAGMVENAGTDRRRKKARLVVTLAVIVNIGILFVFKYMTFAMENLQKLIPSLPVWQIALPIGISFYTFQGLSYVIDVYRDGGKSVQKNPV